MNGAAKVCHSIPEGVARNSSNHLTFVAWCICTVKKLCNISDSDSFSVIGR